MAAEGGWRSRRLRQQWGRYFVLGAHCPHYCIFLPLSSSADRTATCSDIGHSDLQALSLSLSCSLSFLGDTSLRSTHWMLDSVHWRQWQLPWINLITNKIYIAISRKRWQSKLVQPKLEPAYLQALRTERERQRHTKWKGENIMANYCCSLICHFIRLSALLFNWPSKVYLAYDHRSALSNCPLSCLAV